MAKAKAKNLKKAPKKSAAKKAITAKKASVKKKPSIKAKKPAPKKASPAKKVLKKKPAQKKSIVKKTTPKKNLQKKPEVKKPAQTKKPATKKVAPAKTSAPKKAAKPVAEKKKPVAAKKVSPKREPAKKAPKPEVDIKEIITKKLGSKAKKPGKTETPAAEEEGRASAGIHFTMDDIMDYLTTKGDDKSASTASSKDLLLKRAQAVKAQAVPKKPMSAASIADILGFNPLSESRAQFEEKDVPEKWKKYYKLLMDVKKRLADLAEDMVNTVSPGKEELTHEQAVQGMDVADIGSKNFERDMAYSLLSSEQAILSEVDAAIERMRVGTYGVCEVTGKTIPESRLVAIPWTRCTIEGQRMREADLKKQKSAQSRNSYGEIGEDMGDVENYDETEE